VTFSKVGSGLEKTMSPLVTLQKELGVKVNSLQTQLAQVHRDIASLSKHHSSSASSSSFSRDLLIVMLIFILQTVLFWLF
jgi:TolA-binding protein